MLYIAREPPDTPGVSVGNGRAASRATGARCQGLAEHGIREVLGVGPIFFQRNRGGDRRRDT
eukprot:5135815-Alexandrium_andersonii.AAC.1